MRRLILILTIMLAALTAAPLAQTDQPTPYKEYQSTTTPMEPLFTVAFTRNDVAVTLWIDSTAYTAVAGHDDVKINPEKVIVERGRVWFDDEGLHYQDQQFPEGYTIPYTLIADTRIDDNADTVVVNFLTIRGDMDRLGRLRRGNEITFDDPITIESKQFIRGLVMSVAGKVEVYGEVNKDVISLFGDIYIGPGATARGDLASVTGRIELSDGASVYGELFSGSEYFGHRRPRFYREENFDLTTRFVYNRVDGATPYLGLKFQDPDSVLPSAWVNAGYAFASSRWRLELGVEQPLYRTIPLALGGSYYRRLASEDDWIITDDENSIFTLLVTEDYKDYWEAEGATLWLNSRPLANLRLTAAYRYEETNWRRAYRQLWSLIGGDDLFRRNYSFIPEPLRDANIAEIDTSTNGSLNFSADYDTRNEEEPFAYPGWRITADLEWSHPDFSSDFDYRRYLIQVRRHQPLHEHACVLLRAAFGNSDGYLPLYKRFGFGGLGTVEGYKFKEYFGTRFWFANAEYRFEFPKTDLAASVFWDVGQIANETRLDSDIDVKNSIGAAVMIGNDIRISLAKRLDRSEDADPRFLVRFNYDF